MEIPANFAQVNLVFTGTAVPTGAEVTFAVEDGVGGTSPLAIAQEVEQALNSQNMDNIFCNSAVISRIDVKKGPTATGPSVQHAVNIPGAVVAAAAPPNTSLLIRKVTEFGGRAGRGRMYWPAPSEAWIDQSGVISGVTVGNLQVHITDFLETLVLGQLVPHVLHGDGSPLTEPTPITALSLDARVATQRRRNRR